MYVRWIVPVAAAPLAHVACAAQFLSVEEAQRAAFAEAGEFRPAALDPGTLAALGGSGWSPKAWQVRSGERELGWFFVDQVIGKSELITYAVALDPRGAVLSVEVLDYRESHGGEIRLAGWRKQFVGKTVNDPVELNRDIKNISGATLSCRHVTEGVQRLLKLQAAAGANGGKRGP